MAQLVEYTLYLRPITLSDVNLKPPAITKALPGSTTLMVWGQFGADPRTSTSINISSSIESQIGPKILSRPTISGTLLLSDVDSLTFMESFLCIKCAFFCEDEPSTQCLFSRGPKECTLCQD